MNKRKSKVVKKILDEIFRLLPLLSNDELKRIDAIFAAKLKRIERAN